jgi:hypothetical protein
MIIRMICVGLLVTIGTVQFGCERQPAGTPQSASGVSKASVTVATGSDGLTVEQRNIKERVKRDNEPGSIKHLYVLSPFTGDVLLYSTVKGKVTSSGKRLTPKSVAALQGAQIGHEHNGFGVQIGNDIKRTGEVLQDDGTYGDSSEYSYWFDAAGNYYQFPMSGGCAMIISDRPIRFGKVVHNLEVLSGELPK